ncbi:Opacity protein [Paenimyroides aquimaris]|uniref:Opacity protein n=1 Tax=Paenimyroides marinum TaxID=1159016 RepID=A0A1H6LVH0_9FLAO|nr:porin family protein [Paenimyroides aquimaris]SEH92802.1 Opacity protein [Paenimyroides aquimaris]
MKKVILSMIALIAAGASAFAQQQVKFGPKAGVNFANLSNIGFDNEMKTGFYVGAFAEIKFNDKFSIQPELLYSSQGTKVSEVLIPFGSIEAKWNLDYINIPILAKYYIVDGFSVEAGPQIGFLVKSETKVESGSSAGTIDTKSSRNSTDFGLGLGLAYDLPMGLFVNGRYNLGFSDIMKDNNGDAIKNNVIQIGIGYKFE